MSHISNFTTFCTGLSAEMRLYTLFADQMIWGVKLLDRPVRDIISWRSWSSGNYDNLKALKPTKVYLRTIHDCCKEIQQRKWSGDATDGKDENPVLSEGSSNHRVSITNPDYFLSDFRTCSESCIHCLCANYSVNHYWNEEDGLISPAGDLPPWPARKMSLFSHIINPLLNKFV